MSIGIANNVSKTRFPEYRSLTGRARYCLDLDGNQTGGSAGIDYVLKSAGGIAPNSGTLSAVIKSDNLTVHDVIFSSAVSSGTNNVDGVSFSVGGGNLQFSATIDSKSNFVGVANSDAISAGTWYHLVGTWAADGSGSLATEFWINWAKQSGSFSDTNVNFRTAGVCVGLDDTGAGERRWGGRIYDMALWEIKLTESQIAALYNNGRPRSPNCIGRSNASGSFGGNYSQSDLLLSLRISNEFGATPSSVQPSAAIDNKAYGRISTGNYMTTNLCEAEDLVKDAMYTV